MIVKKLKGDTKMNDLKNTRKSNIKTAAMFLAFIAAIAFIMGYAVLTASATHISGEPVRLANTVSECENKMNVNKKFRQGFFYDADSGKVSLGIVKLDDKTFRENADFVIDNSETLEEATKQIDKKIGEWKV